MDISSQTFYIDIYIYIYIYYYYYFFFLKDTKKKWKYQLHLYKVCKKFSSNKHIYEKKKYDEINITEYSGKF